MIKTFSPIRLFLLILSLSFGLISAADSSLSKKGPEIKKALVIGDSMAGWLGERLNAYGQSNGFEVGTVVWDGATLQKYANSSSLKNIIDSQNPEVVFFCLGMNNMGESNPGYLKPVIDKFREAVGDREMVWIGPPSWPGKPQWTAFNKWLGEEIGENRYFNSYPLTLPRQSKTNPHPTKEGMIKWGDEIVKWLGNTDLNFTSLDKPTGVQMTRGKFFLYKRMKENL